MNVETITPQDYYTQDRYDITLIHKSLLHDDVKPWCIPQYEPPHDISQSSIMQMQMYYEDMGYDRFVASGLNAKTICIISDDVDEIGKQISRGHPRRVAIWISDQSVISDIMIWFQRPSTTYMQSVMLVPPSQFLISFVLPQHIRCDITKYSLWNKRYDITIHHNDTYHISSQDILPYPIYGECDALEMVVPSHDRYGYYDFVHIGVVSGDDDISDDNITSFSSDWWNEIWNAIRLGQCDTKSADVHIVRKSVMDVGYPINTNDMIRYMRWKDVSSYDHISSHRERMHAQLCCSIQPQYLWFREAYRMWCGDTYHETVLRMISQNTLLHKALVSYLEKTLPRQDCQLRNVCCFISENDVADDENDENDDVTDVDDE